MKSSEKRRDEMNGKQDHRIIHLLDEEGGELGSPAAGLLLTPSVGLGPALGRGGAGPRQGCLHRTK